MNKTEALAAIQEWLQQVQSTKDDAPLWRELGHLVASVDCHRCHWDPSPDYLLEIARLLNDDLNNGGPSRRRHLGWVYEMSKDATQQIRQTDPSGNVRLFDIPNQD